LDRIIAHNYVIGIRIAKFSVIYSQFITNKFLLPSSRYLAFDIYTCHCLGSGHSPLARHHGCTCSIYVHSVWNFGVNKVVQGEDFIPALRFSQFPTASFHQRSLLTRPLNTLHNLRNLRRRITTRLMLPYFFTLACDRIQFR